MDRPGLAGRHRKKRGTEDKRVEHGEGKMAEDKRDSGQQGVSLKGDLAKPGTRLTGFCGDGPATCMDCAHRTPHSKDASGQEVDSCKHPLVMRDPELEDRRLPDGTIRVDADDWCQFRRKAPKEGEGAEASNQEGKAPARRASALST